MSDERRRLMREAICDGVDPGRLPGLEPMLDRLEAVLDGGVDPLHRLDGEAWSLRERLESIADGDEAAIWYDDARRILDAIPRRDG